MTLPRLHKWRQNISRPKRETRRRDIYIKDISLWLLLCLNSAAGQDRFDIADDGVEGALTLTVARFLLFSSFLPLFFSAR